MSNEDRELLSELAPPTVPRLGERLLRHLLLQLPTQVFPIVQPLQPVLHMVGRQDLPAGYLHHFLVLLRPPGFTPFLPPLPLVLPPPEGAPHRCLCF